MAKLTKVRTKKKPRETVLVDGEWTASRVGKGWVIRGPVRTGWYRGTGPMQEEHVRVVLSLSRQAYERGRADVQWAIRDALDIGDR